MQHGKRYTAAADEGRPRGAPDGRRGHRPSQGARVGEVRRDRRAGASGSGSTRGRPTRSSAARSRCPRAPGTTVRVIVFAAGEQATEAREAGADEVGADDLVAKIRGGFLDFDVAIATPDLMGQVGHARPRARAARPHAEPEDRDGHDGGRQGRRASSRQAGSSTARTRWATSTCAWARSPSTARTSSATSTPSSRSSSRAKPVGGQGPVPRVGHGVVDDGPRRPDRPAARPRGRRDPGDRPDHWSDSGPRAVGSHGSRPRSRAQRNDAEDIRCGSPLKGPRARLTRWLREGSCPPPDAFGPERAGTRGGR